MGFRARLLIAATLLTATSLGAGCASCGDTANQGECPTGEQLNPVTGECTPRVRGGDNNESDAGPNNETDGGGTPDADAGGSEIIDPLNPEWEGPWQPAEDPSDIEFFSCEPEDYVDIEPPNFAVDFSQNFMFGLPYDAAGARVTRTDSQEIASFAFEDADIGYAGFVLASAPPAPGDSVADLADHVLDTVTGAGFGTAAIRNIGYQVTTHDRLPSIVLRQVSLGSNGSLGEERDEILAALAGTDVGMLDHSLTGDIAGDGAENVLTFQVLRRSSKQYIVVGVVARASELNDPRHPVFNRVADAAGGTAVAWANARLAQDCISYIERDTPEVDIIISLDQSGSMDAVGDQLQSFAAEFTQLLDDEGVDWRIGVTGVDCESIQSDTTVSAEFRALWPEEGYGGMTIQGFEIPGACEAPTGLAGIESGDNNGKLIGGNFTRDPAVVAQRFDDVSRSGFEYSFTMGLAALDRSIPRADAPDKLRPNAAAILVVVTDELEQLYTFTIPALSNSPDTLSAAEQAELELAMQPWLDYATQPAIDATIFGLYWPPGENCPAASDDAQVAHDVAHAVAATGGQGGNVCDADVTGTFRDVASVAGGLASGIRLNGVPFSPTLSLQVERENGDVDEVERRRDDGYDYDFGRLRIVFFDGPSVPLTEERITIPYLRWQPSAPPCETATDCPSEFKQCNFGQCE